jgi:hypothetical protein
VGRRGGFCIVGGTSVFLLDEPVHFIAFLTLALFPCFGYVAIAYHMDAMEHMDMKLFDVIRSWTMAVGNIDTPLNLSPHPPFKSFHLRSIYTTYMRGRS